MFIVIESIFVLFFTKSDCFCFFLFSLEFRSIRPQITQFLFYHFSDLKMGLSKLKMGSSFFVFSDGRA